MVAKSQVRSLAVLLLCPPAAFALGLGDIHLKSALNAPLDAEIDLVGATSEDLAGLRAQVAPQDAFARANLEWSKFLTTVNLRQVHTQDGREVIQLHSSDSITEPFLTLLIQVTWPRGQLLREYTVLLDPPVYTPGAQAPAAVAAPVSGASALQGSVDRDPAPSALPSTPISQASYAPVTAASPARVRAQGASAPAPSASAASAAGSSGPPSNVTGGSYTVRRGDTLSKLASQYGETGQNRRWMVAAYQGNTSAFDGNINSLRSGAILRLPDADAISAVSASAAAVEVSRQYAAWRQTNGQTNGQANAQPGSQSNVQAPAKGQGAASAASSAASAPAASDSGRLKLVTPSERPSAGTAGTSQSSVASTAAASAAADAKVRDLQAQLEESRRLLEMRNSELAQLQSRLGAQTSTPARVAAPPAAAAPVQAPPAETAPATPPVAATPAPAAEAPAAAPAAVVPAPAAAAAAPEEDSGLMGTLKKYWWAVALLVVAIAAALGLRSRRAREEAEFGDSLGRLAAAGGGSSTVDALRQPSGETMPLRQPALPEVDNFLVEESGSHTRPIFDASGSDIAPAAPSPSPRNVSADQTISSDTAINLDQGDPLAEADFHMAYGLYDQAADLIRMAIAREPERRDLKLKLLEVFFVWGNKDHFLQTARELASTRDSAAPGEWEKIVIMGKQLAPEDALFSGDQTMSSAAANSVDIDLDSGSRTGVDFDLLGEPIHELGHDDDVDLDIGGALGEPEPIRAEAGEATDRNLALDSKLDINFDDPSDAAPTVEQPNFGAGANPTIRQKVEMALKQGGGIDQTAELAIDDLGLDLGALDTVDQPGLGAGPDAPTLVAGLDDRSRRVIENAESRAQGQDTVVSSTSPTGPWQFSEDEGGERTQQMPTHDDSPTSRLAALKERDLDFELDSDPSAETGENAAAPANSGIDLDVGTPAIADSSYTETQQIGQDELALPNLEPVTMSEVGTKLDLARAYMDMGDPEGARNILDEVLQEGSTAQKQEAQRLLESLPG